MTSPDLLRPTPLTLGTAQLGLPYGIANRSDLPSHDAAMGILTAAWESGIRCFDTAPAYGEAENRIGRWVLTSGAQPGIMTKLRAGLVASDLTDAVAKSRQQLAYDKTADSLGLMVHHARDLSDRAFAAAFRNLKEQDPTLVLGVSCYDLDDLALALSIDAISLLQIPVSAFNMTFLSNSSLADACSRGIVVYARSAFVQGVLTMMPSDLPNHLAPLAPALARFRALAADADLTPAALALGTVLAQDQISSVVVGADNRDQILTNAKIAKDALEPELVNAAIALGRDLPRSAIDPSLWPTETS